MKEPNSRQFAPTATLPSAHLAGAVKQALILLKGSRRLSEVAAFIQACDPTATDAAVSEALRDLSDCGAVARVHTAPGIESRYALIVGEDCDPPRWLRPILTLLIKITNLAVAAIAGEVMTERDRQDVIGVQATVKCLQRLLRDRS
jgi:hypothetical protein